MASRFDELQSEVRRRPDEADPSSLQGNMRSPVAPPPYELAPPSRLNPQDPSTDTFDQRFYMFPLPAAPGRPVLPGTQERFLDPSKVISTLPPGYSFTRVAASNPDQRTPAPLPIAPATSLAPHNPNPPGGGPYSIRPGERLPFPPGPLTENVTLPPGYSFTRRSKNGQSVE